jgi:uncharacterized RDD family membrane protein YckC
MTSQVGGGMYGMEVDLPKATLLKRWGASFCDEGILHGVTALLGGVLSGGVLLVLGIVASICQDMPFGGGTSVGRKIVDQVLVNRDGTECTYADGARRNALRALFWYGSCGIVLLVDIGLVLFHPKGLTSVDLVLKTQVVDRPYALLRSDQLPGGARPQIH